MNDAVDALKDNTIGKQVEGLENLWTPAAKHPVPALLEEHEVKSQEVPKKHGMQTYPKSFYVPNGKHHFINKNFPGLQLLCQEPSILQVPNFLTDDECKGLIRSAEAKGMSVSKVTAGKGIAIVKEDVRSSSETFLSTELAATIQKRISSLTQASLENFQKLKVSAYGPGGHFRQHYDDNPSIVMTPYGYPQTRSNKMITVILYLTTCTEGGTTDFTNVNLPCEEDQSISSMFKSLFVSPTKPVLSIKPVRGTAVIFFPSFSPTAPGDLKNARDELTAHRASPVVGSKWVAQQWIWGGPFKCFPKLYPYSERGQLWEDGDDEDRATLLAAAYYTDSKDERALEWLKDRWSVWQQNTPSWVAKIPKGVLEAAGLLPVASE